MSAGPSARDVAASARAAEGSLLERLAIHADALAVGLSRTAQLVAWDREQLIGATQTRLRRLAGQRLALGEGGAVRVLERRDQPLEAIELTWAHLRRGHSVFLEYETGCCDAVVDFMRGMSSALVAGALVVSTAPGLVDDDALGPRVGVDPPGPRIALVDTDADRELAAYLLVRASLRRSGADPRSVKVAYVCGATDSLQRQLTRLWVGATIGPATDTGVFAGPITAALRDRFLEACERWRDAEGVETWCAGAALERTGDPQLYAAPALYFAEGHAPQLPIAGPMLVVVACDAGQAKAAYEAAVTAGGHALQIGGRAGLYPGSVRHIRGALLVERLPPGLPEPRPV